MFAIFILSVYLFVHAHCDENYTNQYDGVDLEEILSTERLLTGYINCLLDSGPCTPDAKELKKNLPDAVENDCSKCTKRQRDGADQVMQYIIDHRPEEWLKLEQKYNENGSYKRKYLASKQSEEEKSTEKHDVSKTDCKEKDES